jgi:hypothetical protein
MSKTFKDLVEWSNVMHPALQKYLKSKGLDPRYVSRNQMISHSKTGDFSKWKRDHYDKARMTHGMESVELEDLDVLEEDKFQDPKAATQTVGMEVESNSRGKQLSKSARIIKSIYKHHGVAEDKDVTVYGKKPKLVNTSEKSSFGDNKPNVGSVLKGGTTLTGEKRDDVEFNPNMQVTNGLTPTLNQKQKITK